MDYSLKIISETIEAEKLYNSLLKIEMENLTLIETICNLKSLDYVASRVDLLIEKYPDIVENLERIELALAKHRKALEKDYSISPNDDLYSGNDF